MNSKNSLQIETEFTKEILQNRSRILSAYVNSIAELSRKTKKGVTKHE